MITITRVGLPIRAAVFASFLMLQVIVWQPRPAVAQANSDAGPESEKPATRKKPTGAAGKIEIQLQKAFKQWDRDKNETIGLEEMEKVYARLKAKPKRGRDAEAAPAPDPMAAVAALHALLDDDKDKQVTRAEFDAWTTDFAAYLGVYVEIQEKRAGFEQEKAKMQQRLDQGAGLFNDQLMAGVIQYDQMIAELDKQVANLDADGSLSQCRDFVVQQVLRGKVR
jgi:hypothetical protein